MHEGSSRWRQTALLFALTVAWAAAGGYGLHLMWAYTYTPAAAATVTDRWPAGVDLPRAERGVSLVLFAHPHCACTTTSLDELRRLLSQTDHVAQVNILVYRPASAPPGWEVTENWTRATAIPGARVTVDVDGAIAERFGAHVSGETMAYAPDGRLLFSGGLTAGRGHAGDSDGQRVLRSLAHQFPQQPRRAHVFGCLLRQGFTETTGGAL